MKTLYKPFSLIAIALIMTVAIACGNTGTDKPRYSELFTILQTFPAPFANEVAAQDIVAIEFTQPIDRSSVYHQTVTVEAFPANSPTTGTMVNANVVVGNDTTLNVALQQQGGWQNNTTYVLTVSPNVMSTGQNMLGAPFTFSFSTGVNWGSVPGKPTVTGLTINTDAIVYYQPIAGYVYENILFTVSFNEDIVEPPTAMVTVEQCDFILDLGCIPTGPTFASLEVQYAYPNTSDQHFNIFFPVSNPPEMTGCYSALYQPTLNNPLVSQVTIQLFNAIDKENYRMDTITKKFRMYEDYWSPAGCPGFF